MWIELTSVWKKVSKCLDRGAGKRTNRMPLCVFIAGVKWFSAIHRDLVACICESPTDFLVISLDAAVFPNHAAAPDEGDAEGGVDRSDRICGFCGFRFESDQPFVQRRYRLVVGEIAQELALSEHTVKKYLFRIFEKLGISTRVELVLYALNHGDHRPAEWLPGTN